MASGDRRLERSLPARRPAGARLAIVHALSLARVALTAAADRARKAARLRQRAALLREELRVKGTRLMRVPAHRRPHDLPVERLAILELRSAGGWSAVQTAGLFFVTEVTVASWMARIAAALVRAGLPPGRTAVHASGREQGGTAAPPTGAAQRRRC